MSTSESITFMVIRGIRRTRSLAVTLYNNVGCLLAFRTLYDLELNRIALLQGSIAVSDNGGVMNKNIRAIVTPDETVPL